MYNPNSGFTIINYPYQIFGITQMNFYDILSDNSSLSVEFNEFGYDFKTNGSTIVVEEFNSTVTDLEVYTEADPYLANNKK